MNNVAWLAQPFWINGLLLVPVALFFAFRKYPLSISRRQLLITAVFGIAFGFVEASVVVYLRAAFGMLPGYMGSLSDVIAQGSAYYPIQLVNTLPNSLLTVEFLREIATIVMLAAVGLIAGKRLKEQFAIFLWSFAFWDLFYYVWLWALVRWPSSLFTPDVLFLIPTPWLAQVWFPCLVSTLSILAVAINCKSSSTVGA